MSLWETLLRKLPGVIYGHPVNLTDEADKREAERRLREIERRLEWLASQRDVSR